jgi:hypothetical protein
MKTPRAATPSPSRRLRAARLATALAFAALPAAGCNFHRVERAMTACQSDGDCGTGFACMGGSCLASGVPPSSWAVELLPPSDSSSAPTQLASVSFLGPTTELTAVPKVTVTGHLAAGSSLGGGSHVIATLASIIPGGADQQLEAEWLSQGSGSDPQFTLTVPGSAIGTTVTLDILPLPPRDQAQPPVTTQVILNGPDVDVAVSSDFVFVTGRLVSALGDPRTGFVARAFQGSTLVSNIATLDTSGGFRLAIPRDRVTAASAPAVTVDLEPSDDTSTDPHFTTRALMVQGNLDIGTLMLPATANPNYFRFVVNDPNQLPVSGATVRVHTVLSNDATGTASYDRSGRTDASGRVDLALVPGPGSNGMPRPYDISVIPPVTSQLGVACQPQLPVTSGGTVDMPSVVPQLQLPSKVTLAGTILSADGLPVAGAAIAATRTAVDSSEACAATATPGPSSGTSLKDGTFQLLVDPGTYRIDYDPPAGAPVPRLTETGVVVPVGGDSGHVVQMLPGALLRGVIVDMDGGLLPSTEVRFFEVVCSGYDACFGNDRVEPILRGDAHSDTGGNFSVVVPVQQ